MTGDAPIHPVDALSEQEKCWIYFRRVVDLAVAEGLVPGDPRTPIGHFAFSACYTRGRNLDEQLSTELARFEEQYPDVVKSRHAEMDWRYPEVIERYQRSSASEKRDDLIRIGASYRVWPSCTSFVLIYPWDLAGRGRLVTFRPDLPQFTKRRILQILKDAGQPCDFNIFER